MTPWDQAREEFKCECTDMEVRYIVASNGVKHFREQCLQCGQTKPIKKTAITALVQLNAVEVDEELSREHSEKVRARAEELGIESRKKQHAQWLQGYSQYLKSEKWQEKRDRVLERDNHLCQACLKRKANQAHHLTYEHVFDEPLFDLISVCEVCHRQLTRVSREKQGIA